ncbi:molybdate ABC transporter permease protein [Planctomycetes bacterium Poly30]|uniref:Molybdate ABC transporter permease protein n=1 Tax=Saltatorellus ferox TaxID=2528018 RepID=A0A518ESM7_9BACT|nr:molybdate ABC transporter permease protein [Planctomycetes bacterium Poly30]
MAPKNATLHPAARPSRWLVAAAFLVFCVLGLSPLLIMFERLAAEPEALESLLNERTLTLLGRTVALGLGASAIALTLGLPFGFLVARTNVFGAPALRALGIVPILIPPIMMAMTWTMILPLRGPVMCALILGVSTFPLVALFTGRAAERIDARREEAATMVGGLGAILRMEFPLLLIPALGGAVLSFIVSINEFALCDYVSAVGKKFNVYAGEIFSNWQVDGNEPRAVATALPLIVLTLLALVPLMALRRKGRYGTVDGRFVAPARLKLGRARVPATLFCLFVVTLSSLVPIGRLLYESGGGPRVFSGVSIRRAAWTQGGGAAQNMPGAPGAAGAQAATDPGAVKLDAKARQEAVRAANNAALRAAGQVPIAGADGLVPQAPMRKVDMNAPEIKAALEAATTDDQSDMGGGLATFTANFKKSFSRAFELSRESLVSSLLFALIAASISLPIALVLGHAIQRGRAGGLLEVVALLPLIVPPTLFGIGTIVFWNHDWTAQIYDSGALVALLFAGRFVAVATLICSGAVASFDPELEESAHLAGAGPLRRLFGIVSPGVWSSLVGAWIVVFALSVRELDAAVLVPAANDTAMFRVFNAVHFGRDDFVSALALLVIFTVLLPGLLWSLFSKARLRILP